MHSGSFQCQAVTRYGGKRAREAQEDPISSTPWTVGEKPPGKARAPLLSTLYQSRQLGPYPPSCLLTLW